MALRSDHPRDLERAVYKESSTAGQPGIVVINPDGTPIAGGTATNVNLNQVGGVAVALGQTTKSASIPVVLPSDQTLDTELPTAAALADDTANPTVPSVGAFGQVWDPNDSNWDRLRAVNATLNAAAADSGIQAVGLVAQFDDTSPTAVTENQFANVRMDANRFLYVTQGTLISGEDQTNNVMKVEEQFSYTNMTTATTTTVKSGAGLLNAITINTPVASATITLYDNTAGSGTKIGIITLGGTLANDVGTTYLYNVKFSTGLTIVTSGATDITISWR